MTSSIDQGLESFFLYRKNPDVKINLGAFLCDIGRLNTYDKMRLLL